LDVGSPETTTETTVASTVIDTVAPPPADAPIEEREEFEATVDIYSGAYDDYVPVGSTISVAERRTIVAATAVVFMLPAPVPASRRMK
jgi:hypothetical protein